MDVGGTEMIVKALSLLLSLGSPVLLAASSVVVIVYRDRYDIVPVYM